MSSPFRFVAALGLAVTACLPLSAEVLVREDFTGYVGASLSDMPVAPGTGLEGAFKVTLGSRGVGVGVEEAVRYPWGPMPGQTIATAMARAVSPYQFPRLQATVSQLPGGGPITGRTVWFRFLLHFPNRNPDPMPAEKPSDKPAKVIEPGIVLMLSERPPCLVGVRNDQPGSGATLRVGGGWSHKFQLPKELSQPVCLLGRLQWNDGAYRSLEIWLNPRAEKDRLIAETFSPAQPLDAFKLTRLTTLMFQWTAPSVSKVAQMPGLGAVAFGEKLEDLMPGVQEPAPVAPGP